MVNTLDEAPTLITHDALSSGANKLVTESPQALGETVLADNTLIQSDATGSLHEEIAHTQSRNLIPQHIAISMAAISILAIWGKKGPKNKGEWWDKSKGTTEIGRQIYRRNAEYNRSGQGLKGHQKAVEAVVADATKPLDKEIALLRKKESSLQNHIKNGRGNKSKNQKKLAKVQHKLDRAVRKRGKTASSIRKNVGVKKRSNPFSIGI